MNLHRRCHHHRRHHRRRRHLIIIVVIVVALIIIVIIVTVIIVVVVTTSLSSSSLSSSTADGCYFPGNATEDPPLAGRRRRPTSSPLLEDERDPADPCFVTGHLDLSKNWYGYLAVMNMQSVGGKLFYRFVYPENACCVKILLYLQEQMDKLRANMNCLQFTSVSFNALVLGAASQYILHGFWESNSRNCDKQAVLDAMSPQVITLSPSIPSSGCSVNRSVIGGVRMIECSSGRMLQSARARHWYVAAVSCGSPTGLNLRYSMLIYGHVGRCPKDYSAPAVAVVARPSSWALIVNRASAFSSYFRENTPGSPYLADTNQSEIMQMRWLKIYVAIVTCRPLLAPPQCHEDAFE
ncbi:hypothetical protein LSAT2_015173 [Lamellibrachia satsuma]|nr:hypothetical protein LSAT2_015173 [Lamellibrachia satsuma]